MAQELGPWRRTGINVGDIVTFRPRVVDEYRQLYDWPRTDHRFVVTFRQAAGIAGGETRSYRLQLQLLDDNDLPVPNEQVVLAKPGHLSLARKNPALRPRE